MFSFSLASVPLRSVGDVISAIFHLEAVDIADVAVVALLGLSAVVDIANHSILCRRWELIARTSFSVVPSSIVARSPSAAACIDHPLSSSSWSPTVSVLGPIVYCLIVLIEKHLCADDAQIYGYSRPSAICDLQQRLSACIDDVYATGCSPPTVSSLARTRRSSSGALLRDVSINWRGLHARLGLVTSLRHRDLRIYIDADLSMWSQFNGLSPAVLRLTPAAPYPTISSCACFQILFVVLVLSKLDYEYYIG